MKGRSPSLRCKTLKESRLRAVDPAAVNGGGLGGRDLPGLLKAAEVIEPDDVAKAQRPAHALYPPVVTALPQHVPAIHGISPALAGFGERIRRDAGDDLGIQIGVEAEKMRDGSRHRRCHS